MCWVLDAHSTRTYCKGIDPTGSKGLYYHLVLGGIEERNDRAPLLDMIRFLIIQRSPDFQHDIGGLKELFSWDESSTGSGILFVQELGIDTSVMLDENLAKALLEEKSSICGGESDALFTRERLSRDTDSEGLVRHTGCFWERVGLGIVGPLDG